MLSKNLIKQDQLVKKHGLPPYGLNSFHKSQSTFYNFESFFSCKHKDFS